MNFFLEKINQNKRCIFIPIMVLFIVGLLFGFIQYKQSSQSLKSLFQYLFYFNHSNYPNTYHIYLIEGVMYILICTYLSTSYLGVFGLLFLIFLKGIQISFSIQYILCMLKPSIIVCIFIFIEGFFEILFAFILNYMCIYLSINVTQLVFYIDKNFNIKNVLNYKLNIIMFALIMLFISLIFRLYVVPLF